VRIDKIYQPVTFKTIGSRQVRSGDSLVIDVDPKNGCLIFLKRHSGNRIVIPDVDLIKRFGNSTIS
jgi:hypothetical protein